MPEAGAGRVPASIAGEERRREVVLVAARLFRNRGYERTSVRDLAEAVGLKSGSLFHYFHTKEEILVAVMSNGIQAVIDGGEALLREFSDPRERLERLFRLHMASLLEGVGGDAMHAMVYEWRSLSPTALARVRQLSAAYERLWHQVINEAVAAGVLRGDPSILLKHVLGGMNFTVRWWRPDGRLSPAELIDAMLVAALPGLHTARS